MKDLILYRIYADGTVVHEDDFLEHDQAQPYYDDYCACSIPDDLERYIYELGFSDGESSK